MNLAIQSIWRVAAMPICMVLLLAPPSVHAAGPNTHDPSRQLSLWSSGEAVALTGEGERIKREARRLMDAKPRKRPAQPPGPD